MQELFRAIQSAASKAVWSRGVQLVRADAVEGDRTSPDEVVLRVTTPKSLLTPTVTLYPDDEDWECSCSEIEDPCEHVVAAAIALRQAHKAGNALPQSNAATARIQYRFRSAGDRSLAFERELVAPDQSIEPLTQGLAAALARRDTGPRIAATPLDMKIEKILPSRAQRVLPAELLARVIDALAEFDQVTLDDQPIELSRERVLPIVRVVDAPGGVRLYADRDAEVTRTYENGAALCGQTLRAAGVVELSGREREDLRRGRFFSLEQLSELVTQILPSLEERLPVLRETECLPDTTSQERPRLHIQVDREGERLSVLGTIVYGSPPCARIDAGRLVHLSGPVPVRDDAAEKARITELRERLGLQPGHRVSLAGDEAIALAERLTAFPGEVNGNAHRAFKPLGELNPRIDFDGDNLNVVFSLTDPSDGTSTSASSARVESEAVLSAWREGSGWVAVEDLGFARLPSDWFERFGSRVADLLAARDDQHRLPACVLPDLALLCDDLDAPPPPGLERLRPLIENWEGLPAAGQPNGFQGELRTYQQQGVDWLFFLRSAGLGALLADDMGLGKTVQAICALQPGALVVVPTSLLYNWAEELARFRPDLDVTIFHGPRRQLPAEPDVVLTSYAILRNDIEMLSAIEWSTLVLDEAQNIKNADSQAARAAYRLRAPFRIALTGTPVENRLEELWSQLHFLNPGLLGGRSDFEQRYARPIASGDQEIATHLRERIRPFVMRRLKKEVAPELPPRTDVILHCELDPEERAVYDAVRAASVEAAVQQLRAGGGVMAALEVLLRLRQAACHPALVPGQNAAQSTKLNLLADRLEQAAADGHRALVFSQWTSLLDLTEPVLGEKQIEFVRLDGSTRDRGGVVSQFADEDGPPVMLVSLKAGGTGLNLTAADHVFLLDPWWNPAVEQQAADRAHRIGQTRPVVVHRIVARDTVEEGILQLHQQKRALSESALGTGSSGEGLSRDDLLGLLDQ
ncbi:MAG: DEAD/DEAH box helicase [Myxococcota bacterium]|nr:DEAD/DEAH box helicase [Myxococcota bacterium]